MAIALLKCERDGSDTKQILATTVKVAIKCQTNVNCLRVFIHVYFSQITWKYSSLFPTRKTIANQFELLNVNLITRYDIKTEKECAQEMGKQTPTLLTFHTKPKQMIIIAVFYVVTSPLKSVDRHEYTYVNTNRAKSRRNDFVLTKGEILYESWPGGRVRKSFPHIITTVSIYVLL